MSDIANLPTNSLNTSLTVPVTGRATYYVRIRAANATGSSVPSNEVMVSVGAGLIRPSAPVDLKTFVTGSTAFLEWQPPASGDSLSAYRLDVGSSPSANDLASFATGDLSGTFRANIPPGVYFARVSAINAAGISPPSNEVFVRVTDTVPCAGPPSIRGSAGQQLAVSQKSTNIGLSAAADTRANSFVVEIGSAPGLADLSIYEAPASGLDSFGVLVYGAFPRGTYFGRVRAKNACGIGPTSDDVAITVN